MIKPWWLSQKESIEPMIILDNGKWVCVLAYIAYWIFIDISLHCNAPLGARAWNRLLPVCVMLMASLPRSKFMTYWCLDLPSSAEEESVANCKSSNKVIFLQSSGIFLPVDYRLKILHRCYFFLFLLMFTSLLGNVWWTTESTSTTAPPTTTNPLFPFA